MKNAAKIAIGSIILLYAIYGYWSGEIYKLPNKHNLGELLVHGQGVVYCALSYVAFAFLFFAWAFAPQTKFKTRRKFLRSPRELSMAVLFFLGITLELICSYME